MEKKIKFTNIRYVPLNGNGESINVAVVLHDFVDGKLYFDKVKRHKRVLSFDDELNLDNFKNMIQSIEEFVNKPFRNDLFEVSKEKYNENYLKNISNMFLNDYRMGEIISVYTNDVVEQFEGLKNIFLYYDIERKNRPNKDEAIKSINALFYSAKRECNLDSFMKDYSLEQSATHGEPIRFDYKIGDNYYKIFNLNGENFTLKFMSSKSWLYNADYLKDNEKLKFIIVNQNDSNEAQTILKILKSKNHHVEIIDSSSFISDIRSEQTKTKSSNIM